MTAPVLLTVAHGSRDPRAGAVVEDLRSAVRRLRPDLDVRAAFLDHSAPSVAAALDAAAEDGLRRVVAVPLLLTEAFHTRTDLPALLAEARLRHPASAITQAAALGPHPLLLAAAERRLREVGVRAGDAGTAVVLGAAGSSDPVAVATVERVAADWERTGWWAVVPGYASATGPTVAEAVEQLRGRGAARVAVAPYVLAPGRLPDRILADAAGADAVADPLGACPEVARLVILRFDEVADRPVLGSL